MVDKETKKHITERSTWVRGLYMLLFAFIYNIAEIVMAATALFQFIIKLATGKTNPQLLAFGQSLSVFIYQVWRYLTFNCEKLPFPFANWPDPKQSRQQHSTSDSQD